jgi:hypothetical protein
MNVEEATAALERAGHSVSVAFALAPGLPELFDVAGLASDVTEMQLIKLAHRHGAWRHAVEGSHSIQAHPPK